MAKRFDVLTPRKGKDKTFWHRVGTAWEGDKGINITFDSLPMPDAEGRCSVSLFEPRDNSQQGGGNRPQGGSQGRGNAHPDDLDDNVPW